MPKPAEKYRSTLVPFDDAVVMLPVRPRPFSAVWIPSDLDGQKRVGRVIAVGPGKIVAGTRERSYTLAGRDPLAPPATDPLKSAAPADNSHVLVFGPERYPMNCIPGDYVLYSQSMMLEPDGPGTRTLLVTRNEFILGRLDGFAEFNEDAEQPNLAVPVPQTLVDLEGRPFRPEGGGRA